MEPNELSLTNAVEGAFRNGKYSLLLGAGASVGAKSEDGRPLPKGDEFSAEIVSHFNLSISAGTPLPYIWEAAVAKVGDERGVRARLTVPRFLKCSPADHHRLLSTFPWKRIFTFNIDDVLPASYNGSTGPIQQLSAVHFDDDYREADWVADECQAVYLHGAELFPDSPIVFGPPAYAAATTRQHTWWHVFADSFLTDPFIVVGATLREPDFEAYLVLKNRPHLPLQVPSFFVSPQIDDAIAATCKRLGLTPIKATCDQFLSHLDRLLPSRQPLSKRYSAQVGSGGLLRLLKDAPEAAVFGRQFVHVNHSQSWPKSDQPPHAFYEGFDPNWDDIASSRDVHRAFEKELAESVSAFLKAPANQADAVALTCLEGNAGAGKTTALMRLSSALATEGYQTFFYVGFQERLRDDLLLQLAEGMVPGESFVAAIDNLSDHLTQVRRFMETFPHGKGRCFVLGAERSTRRKQVESRMSGLPRIAFRTVPPLTTDEALDLAGKLRLAAKLGELAGTTDAALAARFTGTRETGWAGQLLAILLDVVPGGRFADRLASEWRAIPDEATRAFYGIVCMASACGVPVRSAIALRALSVLGLQSGGSIFSAISTGALRGLVVWSGENVKPRHRVIAEATLNECVDGDVAFRFAHGLAIALAPYVSRKTIISKSGEARLAPQLMDADGAVVPLLGNRADEWFQLLEQTWGWNSRYWEQRSLSALKRRQYARARDFAQQAVGIEQHPLPITTCALVQLASAESDRALGQRERDSLFDSAIGYLDRAIRLSLAHHRAEIHPYHILLNQACRVARRLFNRLPDNLASVVRSHAQEARRLFGRNQEISTLLDQFSRESGSL